MPWQPTPWEPTPWGPDPSEGRYRPSLPPGFDSQNPYAYLPQPTPGVESTPYVPDDAANVIPEFGGAPIAGPVGGVGRSVSPYALGLDLAGRAFLPGINSVREGLFDRLLGAGAGVVGAMTGAPFGGLIGGLLYDRIFNPEAFTATTFPEGYTYEDYQRDLNTPNNFLSRQREGSTRFSTGEMDLSNLPIERSAQQYMPAVFAGERGSALPGSDRPPYVEAR